MALKKLLVIVFLMCIPLLTFARTVVPRLTSVKVASVHGDTKLYFTLSSHFHYTFYTSNNPARLVVDFLNTQSTTSIHHLSYQRTLIHSGRLIQAAHHRKVRFIFSLKSKAKAYSALRKLSRPTRYQLVLKLVPFVYHTKKYHHTVVHKVSHTYHHVPIGHHTQGKLRKAIVIIDPGHGGKDPGAIGHHSTREKNVVLGIAKDLYADLKKQPHIEPVLTRHGDYFVPLRNRLKLARKGKGDLFLAIHADAYKNVRARGATVFALSERGATSEAARWLARKENYSELGGVNLSDKSYVLRSVLLDLSQTATIRESLQFGYSELQTLSKVARLHEPFVEQAPFVVLKSPDIPSLLIETGFISNVHEERLLGSSYYQRKLAQALTKGIVDYLRKHPPAGTYFVHSNLNPRS